MALIYCFEARRYTILISGVFWTPYYGCRSHAHHIIAHGRNTMAEQWIAGIHLNTLMLPTFYPNFSVLQLWTNQLNDTVYEDLLISMHRH